MSSLQQRFGLPTDLTPSVCHSVLLIVHLSSFTQAMCPAHVHFVLVTYWTMSVTLVLCPMVVLRILSSSLILSNLLSIARWLVSSFFTNASVRDHVWHPYPYTKLLSDYGDVTGATCCALDSMSAFLASVCYQRSGAGSSLVLGLGSFRL